MRPWPVTVVPCHEGRTTWKYLAVIHLTQSEWPEWTVRWERPTTYILRTNTDCAWPWLHPCLGTLANGCQPLALCLPLHPAWPTCHALQAPGKGFGQNRRDLPRGASRGRFQPCGRPDRHARCAGSLPLGDGQGLGAGLLKDAIRRSLLVAEQAGIRARLSDPIDAPAAGFQGRFGFEASPLREQQWLPVLADARRAAAWTARSGACSIPGWGAAPTPAALRTGRPLPPPENPCPGRCCRCRQRCGSSRVRRGSACRCRPSGP